MGDIDINYRQYLGMQADMQRSRFWRKEYGGWLMEDGSYVRFNASQRANLQINDVNSIDGAKALFHTHWAAPGRQFFTNSRGNIISDDPKDYFAGQRVAGKYETSVQYHSPNDMSNPVRSILFNRYNGSYYPGYGNYSIINPPINRFVYSFIFWK